MRPLLADHVIFRYLPTTQKLNRKRIKGYESAKDKFNGNKYSPWYKRFEVGRYYKLEHHAASESVPEMVPQLVVPDLTDCDLKPYVSYRTTDIYQVRTIMLQWTLTIDKQLDLIDFLTLLIFTVTKDGQRLSREHLTSF